MFCRLFLVRNRIFHQFYLPRWKTLRWKSKSNQRLLPKCSLQGTAARMNATTSLLCSPKRSFLLRIQISKQLIHLWIWRQCTLTAHHYSLHNISGSQDLSSSSGRQPISRSHSLVSLQPSEARQLSSSLRAPSTGQLNKPEHATASIWSRARSESFRNIKDLADRGSSGSGEGQ